MKAGATIRLNCQACETEFEITLEPKAKEDSAEARKMPDQDVEACPFCGDPVSEDDE